MEEQVELEYTQGEQYFYLHVPYDRRERAKAIGGVWTQGKKAWKFPVDVNIWNEIRQTFHGEGIVARAFVEEIDRRRAAVTALAEQKTLAESDTPVEFGVEGVSLNGANPFFNYQKWGIKCCLDGGDGFLIADQPGLGKSIQAIGTAIARKRRGEIENCLIVCLASLKYNWLDEIRKFTAEDAIVIDGTKEERKKKWLAKGYFFKIVNYEIVVADLLIDPQRNAKQLLPEEIELRRYLQRDFDMVVVDEIHAIKHHASQRTMAVKQFQARYRLGLSGTPVDGRLEELHSIYGFLKPGLFESRSKFMDKHAVTDMWGKVKAYTGVGEVREKIYPYYLRRLKENVLKDLPPKLYKTVYVELGKPEMKTYKDLISGTHAITEETEAAVKIIRVRQFLNFPELLGLHNASAKFDALSELLEELIDANGEKVIVFTQFKETLDLLQFNLKGRYDVLAIHGGVDTKERVEIVKDFNEHPERQILIGTDAMSTGLNIGSANSVINYEDCFSPAIMQQREDRAHRATTKHNVTVYRFVCKNTFEEKVRTALGDKMNLNNSVLDEDCTTFGNGSFTNLDLLKFL